MAAWLIWGNPPENNPEVSFTEAQIKKNPEEAQRPPRDIDRTIEESSSELRILDWFSGEEYKGMTQIIFLVDGEENDVPLDQPESAKALIEILQGRKSPVTAKYLIPGVDSTTENKCNLDQILLGEDEIGYFLKLPIFPRLSVSFVDAETGAALSGGSGLASVVDRELWMEHKAEAELDELNRIHALPSTIPDATLIRYQVGAVEKGGPIMETKFTAEETSISEFSLPASGFTVIQYRVPNYTSFSSVEPYTPNEKYSIEVKLFRKPILFGRVVSDQMASEYEVKVAVLLNPNGFDFALDENAMGFSLSGLRTTEGEEARLARAKRRLNDLGEFSIRLPRGQRYLVEISHPSGQYLSEEISLLEILQSADSPIEWGLSSQDIESESVEIEIVDSTGFPAGQARVLIQPYQDFPWFRVYPKIHCNEFGIAKFPWGKIGDQVVVAVFLEEGGGEAFSQVTLSARTRIKMSE